MKELLKVTLRRAGFRKTGATALFARRAIANTVDWAGRIFFHRTVAPEIDAGSIRKILVIRVDRLGDLVLSTPALRALRRAYPAARIHLMVLPYTREAVVTNPNVDRILLYGIDRLERDYDLAVALHPGFHVNRLTYRCGARHRFGFAGAGGSFFLTRSLEDDRATRVRHEVESALEIAALAGGTTDDRSIEVSVTGEGEMFADRFLEQHGFSTGAFIAGIHPGSRQKYLRWNKEGYAAVADELARSRDARILLFAGPGEEALAGEVARLMRHAPIIASGLSLTRLISLVKRCRIFISNSTGPMHVAAALNVPVVAIFGPAHPLDSYQEWGPWSKNSVVVTKRLSCPGCHPSDCATFDCIRDISTGEVLDAVNQLLPVAGLRDAGRELP